MFCHLPYPLVSIPKMFRPETASNLAGTKWPGLHPCLDRNHRSFWMGRNESGLVRPPFPPFRPSFNPPLPPSGSNPDRRGEGRATGHGAGDGAAARRRTGGELVLRRLLTSKPPPSSSLPSSLPSARFLLGFPVRSIPTKGGDEAERRGGSGSAGAVLPPSTAIGDGL